MWSHYGDNHKGICLEFGVENLVFGTAQEVRYLSSYPKWAPHSLMNPKEPHVLLTKSDDWKYEREYRVIGLGEGIDRPIDDHPLMLSGRFLSLPKDALQAVIVGCEANYQEIEAITKAVAPTVKIKRAVRSPSKFRVEIAE
jgi:hypothetical protein